MMVSTRILVVCWVAACWLLVPAALARADDGHDQPIVFTWTATATTLEHGHHHRHGCPLNPSCFGLPK